MKKHILILICVILVLSGCSNHKNNQIENQYDSPLEEFYQTQPATLETVNESAITLPETTIVATDAQGETETEATFPSEAQPVVPSATEEIVPAETQDQKPAETDPYIPPETAATVPADTEPAEAEPTTPPSTEPAQKETEPQQSEPAPTEPERSGDIYSSAEVMAVGNSYGTSAYGMSVDYSLGFSNASYEFADAAYVSGLKVLGGQSYLNQMVVQKIDSLVANLRGAYGADTDISAYRLNCWVEYDDDGELYWIYVFYG